MVWLQRWCGCFSGKEDWVFGVPQDWHQRPIGRLGQTVCLRCMHEHNMCVLSSWKNWMDLHREPSACGKPWTQPRCWPVKAWRCQSGPDSQSPISARRNQSIQRWESGLTVGNFTHQLLATPFLQLVCACHRCPQTTKLCGHHNEVFVLHATSAVCPHVRRPHFRLKSSARCSCSVCTCPSTWTHDSANCWSCMVTTDQHVHGSVLKPRVTPAEAWPESAVKQVLAPRRTKCFAVSTSWHRQMTSIDNGLPFWGGK